MTKEFFDNADLKLKDRKFESRIIAEAGMKGSFEVLARGCALREMKKQLGLGAPDNDKYVAQAIEFADGVADIFSRVCTPAELRSMMPPAALDQDVAAEYRRRGANALAAICGA